MLLEQTVRFSVDHPLLTILRSVNEQMIDDASVSSEVSAYNAGSQESRILCDWPSDTRGSA